MNRPPPLADPRIDFLTRAISPRRPPSPGARPTPGLAELAPPRGRLRERGLKGALLRLAIQRASEDARRRQALRRRAEQTVRRELTSAASLGFSLVEMVGVLAVIAILATAVVPPVMKQMDDAARTKEMADQSAMAAALKSHVLRAKSIPDATTWAAVISDEAMMPMAAITNTPRGYARAFLIDTNGWLGTVTLPYNQTTNGTATAPASARMMIVATLGRALPLTSGQPPAATFNDIWNTPQGAKPSTWTTWAGNGGDLLIQRINLAPLFHRLILVNSDVGGIGGFAIDGSAPLAVPVGGSGWDAYYLEGTVFGLYDTNTALMVRAALESDTSCVFESGVWRDGIQSGVRTAPQDIVANASQFLSSPAFPRPAPGADPASLASLMYSFMSTYNQWATESPPFSRGQNAPDLLVMQGLVQAIQHASIAQGFPMAGGNDGEGDE